MDKLLNTGLGHLSLFSIMTSPINVIFGTASLLVHNIEKCLLLRWHSAFIVIYLMGQVAVLAHWLCLHVLWFHVLLFLLLMPENGCFP